MKCYYQREDDGDEWVKGEILSLRGGTEITFHSRDDEGRVAKQVTLWNPEVLFSYEGIRVTGFLSVEKPEGDNRNLYRLYGVDVRWTKPRDKK